jgi:hypothetical protein
MAQSRLADILKNEYKTKGIIEGGSSALAKHAREKMDIRNSLFGGSGLGSIIGRKLFGKGYSAIDSVEGSSKVSEASSDLSGSSSGILQEISASSKLTAKNTLTLPSMARDMFLVKQNMVKMVKLQGGTPQTKAGDWFSRQQTRENAFESKFNKGTAPTKVEEKKETSSNTGLLGILAAAGSIFASLLKPLGSLAGIAATVGLAVGAFGRVIWKILGVLVGSKIGKILGLGALIVGANSAFGGDTNVDGAPGAEPTNGGEDSSIGKTLGNTALGVGGAIAGASAISAGSKMPALAKATGTAVLDAKTMSVGQLAKSTPKSMWGKFLAFVAEKSPKLWGKLALKLAQAGALAAIPIVGWVGAAIQLGFSLWTAWELYELWREFNDIESKSPAIVDDSGYDAMGNATGITPTASPSPSPVTSNSSSVPGTTPTAVSGASSSTGSFELPKGKSISSNEAIDYLVKKGMTPAQAAGVVGNLLQESRLNSGAHNKSEGAYGIAQWRLSRLTDLQNFAAAKGKPIDDINTQLDFILHELNGKEKRAGQMLFASKTADEAAYNFGKYYERPKTVEQSRLSYASQSLAQYKPTGSSTGVELAQGDAMSGGGAEIMASATATAVPQVPSSGQKVLAQSSALQAASTSGSGSTVINAPTTNNVAGGSSGGGGNNVNPYDGDLMKYLLSARAA